MYIYSSDDHIMYIERPFDFQNKYNSPMDVQPSFRLPYIF